MQSESLNKMKLQAMRLIENNEQKYMKINYKHFKKKSQKYFKHKRIKQNYKKKNYKKASIGI